MMAPKVDAWKLEYSGMELLFTSVLVSSTKLAGLIYKVIFCLTASNYCNTLATELFFQVS